MKQTYAKYLMVAALTGALLFTSCRTARETTAQYEVTKVEGYPKQNQSLSCYPLLWLLRTVP